MSAAAASHQALYLGPMAQAIDDYGNVFRRGVMTPLNVHDWQALQNGRARDSFLFVKPEGIKGATYSGEAAPAPGGAPATSRS